MSDTATLRRLRVFLCHSNADKPKVRDLFRRLATAHGFDPWFDEESLLPGAEWEGEIRKAVQAADIVLVCLSQQSVTKNGFVQKEIQLALDAADQRVEGTFSILPVRLEPCELPSRLWQWQVIDLFEDDYRHLLDTLRSMHSQLQQRVAAARARHAELVDKRFASKLEPVEERELRQIELLLDAADAPFYEPIKARLRDKLDQLRGTEETPLRKAR